MASMNLDKLDIQSRLSKTWRVFGKHEVTYTGGHVQYSKDFTHMICCHGEDPTKMIFFRLKTGQIVHEIECGEEDPIGTFTLSPNQQILYTFHTRSSLIKAWNIETKQLNFQFKSEHKNDVVLIECDPTGTLLATASLDQTVRVRYTANGHLTHVFPTHGSPITAMTWHPSIDKLVLAVGTQGGVIRVHWLGDGTTGAAAKYIDLLREDYDGTPNKSHVSKVTAMAWSHCQTKLVSVGYDKMWRVWDFCYEHNVKLTQNKEPRRAVDMLQHFQPMLSLSCTEIGSHLILDELENVSVIPYGTPVPMRKKDSNEYVSRVLQEDNNCVYFLTSGTKGVSSIWKLNYDYQQRKKQIGIIFKHQSIQSYQSNNMPYHNKDYENRLYAQTPEQIQHLQQQQHNISSGADDNATAATNASATANGDDQYLFETPLHLQWHKQHLFVPPSMILNPITTTVTKTITLKDGSKIQKTITKSQQKQQIPQLPKLDSDKEYEKRLLDEKKYYESQQLVNSHAKFQDDARKQTQLNVMMDVLDEDAEHEAADAVMNDQTKEGGDEKKDGEEKKDEDDGDEEEPEDAEITAKLQEFRGIAPTNPCLCMLNGDHNLYMFDFSTFNKDKVFTFYQQQINDVKIIPNTRCVIVATNSKQLRIFNVDTLHCDVLFPHNDMTIAVAVSACGRFAMSSTLTGEIFVWALYHYDDDGYIPPSTTKSKKQHKVQNDMKDGVDQEEEVVEEEDNEVHNGQEENQDITLPKPYNNSRRATHISAHIVAELRGHKEAPSALSFSHDPSPHYDHALTVTTHLDQSNSKSEQASNIRNYNRMNLYACTAGSDRTIRTWNLSSLYAFTDPAIYKEWSITSQYYQSFNQLAPDAAKQRRQEISEMTDLSKHVLVQLWDKNIVNASYILYHNLLALPTSETNSVYQQLQVNRIRFTPVTTTLAHDKDINALTIHPNNLLIATCSEDKTCKIWKYNSSATNATSLQLVAILKGHRRSIWNMMFMPREKYIITVSSDKLIKVWSTQDYSCVATIQGHTAAVVSCTWIRYGMQFMTADTNGILRLWNLNDATLSSGGGDCVAVCDEPHNCRVSGLDVDHYHGDSFMVSGDSASTLVFWHDTTLYDELMAQQKQQSEMLQVQLLENALQRKEYERSFELALKLQHTRRLYHILTEIIDLEQRYKRWKALATQRSLQRQQLRAFKIKQAQQQGNTKYDPDEDPDIVGQEEIFLMLEARENLELKVTKPKVTIEKLLKKRSVEELELLTNLLLDWNTNSKFSFTTQYVLNTMFRTLDPLILADVPKINDKLAAFIAYTQRHYTRLNTLLQSSYLVDHVLGNMNIYMPLHDLDRANKILQAQIALKEGQDDDGPESFTQTDLLSATNDNAMLQSIISLNVDDSLLQYETISDDEGGAGLDAASQLAYSMNQKQPLRYFIDESNEDIYNDDGEYDGSEDDGYYYDDEDDSDYDDALLAEELAAGGVDDKDDPFVMLPPISTVPATDAPKFDFDSMWGDFGGDWEALGAATEKNNEEKPDDSMIDDSVEQATPQPVVENNIVSKTNKKKVAKGNKTGVNVASIATTKQNNTEKAKVEVQSQEKKKESTETLVEQKPAVVDESKSKKRKAPAPLKKEESAIATKTEQKQTKSVTSKNEEKKADSTSSTAAQQKKVQVGANVTKSKPSAAKIPKKK